MKQILLFPTLAFCLITNSQNLIVQSGASLIAAGAPTIVLNNVGLDAAADTTDLQNANLVVAGDANCLLKNSSAFINLQKLTIDKPGATLSIANHVQVFDGVQMVNGLFDLSGKNLYLSSASVINGETETARITGLSGGIIQKVINLSASSNVNPGNMGMYISTAANVGLVTVIRGHKLQTGNGLSSAINRYYECNPANTALNATLKFTYFDAELNGQSEAGLQLLESTTNGSTWNSKTTGINDATANYVVASGLNSLYRYTLGAGGMGLPVTGLEFFAKRISAANVQLNWKTIQEISNAGFAIERKRETENGFTQKSIVASKAANGNSTTPLDYTAADTNSYAGKTYYRLKQTDLNGAFAYSVIRVIDGSSTKTGFLAVWPVPAFGNVHVRVEGISKDAVEVWDAGGRLVKQLAAEDSQTYTIAGLAPGTYIIRMRDNKELSQKIVIQ